MSALDVAKLIFLAAIWGGSFIFLRIAVPDIGPLMVAYLRMSVSAIALVAFALAIRTPMDWKRNMRAYGVVGIFATLIPFSCFSFASQFIPASYSALLNATSPLFGALFSVLWLAERMSVRRLTGLALGVLGVGIIVGAGAIAVDATVLLAVAACLFAAASYAVSSIIVRKAGHPADDSSHRIDPIAMASGSMAAGALLMTPALPFFLPGHLPAWPSVAAILALALLGSGVAQAMFIPLIVRVGPTRAMSVAFLIPLFGIVWARIFLDEHIGLTTVAGGVTVLAAMALVLSSHHAEPEDALTAEA